MGKEEVTKTSKMEKKRKKTVDNKIENEREINKRRGNHHEKHKINSIN